MRAQRFMQPPGSRLPKTALITKGREIREVLRAGNRVRTASLDVFVRPSPLSRPRLGFVVPKAGHRIVDRNRLKRRLREIGRTGALSSLFGASANKDILIRTRRRAYDATWSELESELMGVVKGICSEVS